MDLNLLALVGAPEGGGNQGMVLLVQLVLFAAIFYFILIRPSRQAQKKHQAMLEALERGDRVVTEGGVIADVIHIRGDEITVKTADSTRLLIARGKIARVIRPESEAEE